MGCAFNELSTNFQPIRPERAAAHPHPTHPPYLASPVDSRTYRRVLPPGDPGPRFHMPMTARRAPRGSAKNCIGIYADIDPELHAAYERAVAERNITKRQLIEVALRRELADPTITAAQGGLYDVA